MTQPPTGSELDPQTAATLAKLNDTLAQIKQLTEDAENYKGQLRGKLTPGAYTVGGRPALSITPTRRFDPARAAEILPADQIAAVSRMQIDPKLAKSHLAPALYELCQVDAGKCAVKPA